MSAIVDRVAVHGENGSVLITRDRNGWYYLEARNRSGGKTVVQLHKDTVKSEEGLLDQLQRFTGSGPSALPPAPEPEPELDPKTFVELMADGMAAKKWGPFDLAYAIQMRSTGSVYLWLAGKGLPRRKYLRPLAAALDLDLDTLLLAYGRAQADFAREAS